MPQILAVDDEELALRQLVRSINEAVPKAEVHAFLRISEVLCALMEHHFTPDICFLDIELPGISGLELARQIKGLCPKSHIFFVTGFDQYALEAFRVHARGYITKPVSPEKIQEEMAQLYETDDAPPAGQLQIHCFGNFGVFVDGKPLSFQYNRTLELMAYLVDRKGAFCTNGEIMGILWEDDPNMMRRKSFFRDLRADLIHTLSDIGCGDVIERQRGKIAIDPQKISCDYFDLLDGKIRAINAYQGEYMRQYSWSEFTLSNIILHSGA